MREQTVAAAEAFIRELQAEQLGLETLARHRSEMVEAIQSVVSGNGNGNGNGHARNGVTRRHKRGDLIKKMHAYLRNRPKAGTHVTEIAAAVDRPYNNVYVALAQSKKFRKTGPATFAAVVGS